MIAPQFASVSRASDPGVTPRRLLSVDEAAHTLHISDRFLRDLIKRGDVRAVRIGRRVLVPRAELERVEREGTR